MIDLATYRQRIASGGRIQSSVVLRRNEKKKKVDNEYFKNEFATVMLWQIVLHIWKYLQSNRWAQCVQSVCIFGIVYSRYMCSHSTGRSENVQRIVLEFLCTCWNNRSYNSWIHDEGNGILIECMQFICCVALCAKQIGCVSFISILLVISGIEQNPGPFDWNILLVKMRSCRTFAELEKVCQSTHLLPLGEICGNCYFPQDNVDRTALKLVPNDIPLTKDEAFPVRTSAFGNCFPCALSRIVYGNEHHQEEMRARVVIESVCNKELYLDDNYLARGLSHTFRRNNIAERYCTYSSSYRPNIRFTKDNIRNMYEQEVMKLPKHGEFCGIWQFHQAANVLKIPIFSVYPHIQLQNLRGDLHRIMYPQEPCDQSQMCFIMWTQATFKANEFNHFVPLVR